MNLKQTLDPKVITILGLLLWGIASVISAYGSEGMIGTSISLLGTLMVFGGVGSLLFNWSKNKKNPAK